MDPYDAGYTFGRLAACLCCVVVVLGAVGALIWWGVRSRSPQPPTS